MLCVKRLASFVHRTSLPASMSPRADAKSAPCFSPRFPPLKMWNRLCMGQGQESISVVSQMSHETARTQVSGLQLVEVIVTARQQGTLRVFMEN